MKFFIHVTFIFFSRNIKIYDSRRGESRILCQISSSMKIIFFASSKNISSDENWKLNYDLK